MEEITTVERRGGMRETSKRRAADGQAGVRVRWMEEDGWDGESDKEAMAKKKNKKRKMVVEIGG